MKVKIQSFESLILFEDAHLIVIDKPPFISSLDDRHDRINLLKLAKKYHSNAQLCHRLDKETSGALIISKDPDAYKFVSGQFEGRQVEKEYHALCDGIHEFKDLKVEMPIIFSQGGLARIDTLHGKKSVTRFSTLKIFKSHTLVKCMPLTGRMHQIRVHLAARKAPITGDLKYGGKPFFLSSVKKNYRLGKFKDERPLIQRLALHAFRIRFRLLSGDFKEVISPYPKDFKVLLHQLEKNL